MSETNTSPFVVVVGFDLSPQSELALAQAIEQTAAHGRINLHVIGVLDSRRSFGKVLEGNKPSFHDAERVQVLIRELADEALTKSESAVKLFVHARIGNPTQEILNLASEAEADLVVVGTHGRHGMNRLLLGSVAEKIVRNAPCPVLVARPHTIHSEEAATEYAPEPPCPACVEKRRETDGATWWCEMHAKKHVPMHLYSYTDKIAPKRPSYAPIL